MKKYILFIILMSLTGIIYSQVPQAISYQAIVRDQNGLTLANQDISIRISVLAGSVTGQTVYTEIHNPRTNQFGLVNIQIGKGNPVIGSFSTIDWGSNSYFCKIEMDKTGGSNFVEVGTSQFLSVPYALFAGKAANSFSGNYSDLTNKPFLFDGNYNSLTNRPIIFDGKYSSLTGTPSLFSGSYDDLINKPSFATVATTGSYNDLTNKPAFFSGSYNDLTNKPALFDGTWTSLSGKPTTLTGYGITDGFSGNYNDLTNKPLFFSGNYNDLTNKPSLFSGNYNDLTNKPVLFNGTWTSLSGKPTTITGYGITDAFSGNYSDLTNKPVLFDGKYSSLTATPALFSGSYADLSNKPTFATIATTGSYNDLTNKPSLFSGSYNDLTNKPVLFDGKYSSLTATPALFSGSYADLSNKPTFATIATTGSYNDLTNKPSLFSGSYNDLTNKPVLFDGKYSSLTGTPALFSGSYADLSNKPTFATIATTGSYNDLTNKPSLFSGSYNDLSNKPALFDGTWTSLSGKPTTLAGYGIADAMSTSHAANGITAANITNWNTAYSWGNHAAAGYLKTYTETDPAFTNSFDFTGAAANDLLRFNGTKWVKFTPNYLTSYTETDPAWTTASANYYTKTNMQTGGQAQMHWNNITNKPTFAAVATSGSYADLTNKPTGNNVGDMQFWNGTSWVMVPVGQPGQFLQLTTSNIPAWSGPTFASLTTTAASSISQFTALTGGYISNDGGAPITARGVCWNTNVNPTITNSKTSDGTGSGIYTSTISGLTVSTTYYVRSYATNSAGTNYGNQITLTTLQYLAPAVSTASISSITYATAISGGNVTDNGGNNVTARGVCWSTAQNPTISDSKTIDGTGNGSFTSNITGLTQNTTYYVRAYATNGIGTSYGNQVSFTSSLNIAPTVTTSTISSIAYTSASGGGNVTSDGGSLVSARGICWSTSQNPTIADNKTTEGTGNGSYTSSITGLTASTTYYVRAYATNSVGTSYGNQVSLTTTSYMAPAITTNAVSGISYTTATCGGNVTADGGQTVTARGICWSTSQNPTIADNKTIDGDGNGAFSSSISGLAENTIFYVRAYATNSIGTSYGNQLSFTTLQYLTPTLTTNSITGITQFAATGGGNITADGGSTVTARGICWSTTQNPTTTNSKTSDGNGTGTFTSSLSGLTSFTTYYVRAYATNSTGTSYGNQVSFKTLQETITDIEGNVYNIVTIGSQVWLSENLRNTKYNDGTDIPNVTDNTTWTELSTPAYSWYNNDATSYKSTYGALYNWYAVGTGKLCPLGWHAPTDAEWTTLTTFLGGLSSAGGKLKEAGTTHWSSPNTGATNSSGFSSLPSGSRNYSNGTFSNLTYFNYYWQSMNRYCSLSNTNVDIVVSGCSATSGFSVRCLKTNLPVINTTTISAIAQTTAIGGGNVVADGGEPITRGICWSTTQNPTITDSKTIEGTGTGIFTSSLSGLTALTTYYVRAYATNSAGTSYGNQESFSTLQNLTPTVTTNYPTDITRINAAGGGNVTADGGTTITGRGVCWSTTQNPTVADSKTSDGTGNGAFTSSIAGLTASTIYYLRAYATNSLGTSYGNQVIFTTLQNMRLTTADITDITQIAAIGGGNITYNGGATITARGVCWSTNQNPTLADSKTSDGSGNGVFTSSITGLVVGTTYYVRAYATNIDETGYGNQVSFTTSSNYSVQDIDGNYYNIITIGSQEWMRENLKTTKYNDGTDIPHVTNNTSWSTLTTPAYCWYNNDEITYKSSYGALYNWYTVNATNNGGKNVCPTGWHVPTDAEWTTLATYLGGESVAGGKLKEIGTYHWYSPNTVADNNSGFLALPGGFRFNYDGTFRYLTANGFWWSVTVYDASYAYFRSLRNDLTSFDRNFTFKANGHSVRCLKD